MELMEELSLALRCEVCGDEYGVPTETIAASQALLAQGCPSRAPGGCSASFYGSLVEPEVLDELRQAWQDLAESARRHGAAVKAGTSLRPPPSRAERRERAQELASLGRWLDDGGR